MARRSANELDRADLRRQAPMATAGFQAGLHRGNRVVQQGAEARWFLPQHAAGGVGQRVVLQIVGQIEHLSADGADRRARRHADGVRAQPVGVTEQGGGGAAQLDGGQAQGAHRGGLGGTGAVALGLAGPHGATLPTAIDDADRHDGRDQQGGGQGRPERGQEAGTQCHATDLTQVGRTNG